MSSAQLRLSREVSVFGTDTDGKPFSQSARAFGMSGFEVTLEGLRSTLKVNDIVGIRHAGSKARFRVLWVGAAGTPRQGQVGLRAVDVDKDIWNIGSDKSVVPRKPSFAGRERRRYPRIPCQGVVTFRCEGTTIPNSGGLRVLSEGGCYIETLSAAPRFSHLDLTVNAEGLKLRAAGVVRDSQVGAGMGIAFLEMDPAYLNQLQEWVFQHSRQ
jgi:PilZ domain